MNGERSGSAISLARQPAPKVDPDTMIGDDELAECGWLVEVRLTAEPEPHSRFFAVGTHHVREAELAILRYPGIVETDARRVCRRLSTDEIACLGLRGQAVRPYLLTRRSRSIVRVD